MSHVHGIGSSHRAGLEDAETAGLGVIPRVDDTAEPLRENTHTTSRESVKHTQRSIETREVLT